MNAPFPSALSSRRYSSTSRRVSSAILLFDEVSVQNHDARRIDTYLPPLRAISVGFDDHLVRAGRDIDLERSLGIGVGFDACRFDAHTRPNALSSERAHDASHLVGRWNRLQRERELGRRTFVHRKVVFERLE